MVRTPLDSRDPSVVDGVGGRCVVGLIGADIGTSATPLLHEREADRLGLRYLYQLIDLSELGLGADAVGTLLVAARRMGFRGLNITHPCKQLVVDYLDELSPEAEVLRAVNTVVFVDGKAVGHNTDLYGFRESFKRGLGGALLDEVVLVGAGGAGAAVAHAVAELGAGRLTVVDAVYDRAEALAAQVSSRSDGNMAATAVRLDALKARLQSADGVVNATPVGMTGYPGMPFPPQLLRSELWVADVVYRPLETALLAHAAASGCRTLTGGGMAVFQALESFRLFSGLVPDVMRMLDDFAALTEHSLLE